MAISSPKDTSQAGGPQAGGPGSARVDRWLSAVRVFKTRSAATEACGGGHVKVNGTTAKASTSVHPGDRVVVQVGNRQRILEVVRAIDKRVGAPIAAECLVDHTPVVEVDRLAGPVFARDRSAGRPTKRDRRELDRLRHRAGDA